jgi:hypothetical protein
MVSENYLNDGREKDDEVSKDIVIGERVIVPAAVR